jgi:hypothetical protein
MIDADFLNMGNHVFIAPMLNTWSLDPHQAIYIWSSPDTNPRPAAGPAPKADFTVGMNNPTGGGGITGPGYYGVSFSYVMDSGYVTPPAATDGINHIGWETVQIPIPNKNPDGTYPPTNAEITVHWPIAGNGQPTVVANAPPGTTGIIIWVTQGYQDNVIQIVGSDGTVGTMVDTGSGGLLAQNAQLFQYNGQIPLGSIANPTTLNFFDTDLTVSADNLPGNGNILRGLSSLPPGTGHGSVALAKYRGRMIIIGPDKSLKIDSNAPFLSVPPGWNYYYDDRIWISNPGQPETFDQLTGFLPIATENDGNFCRTAFELFGNLYICKGTGTFVTQDSGGEPLDPVNPWIVNLVDGGIGAYHHAVGTISGSQSSLSFNSTAFLANRNGLFLFNGNVLRPELTWKIRNTWNKMTHGSEAEIRVAVDIYNDLFYVIFSTGGAVTPNIFLVGDYSLGLDSQNIRWSIYKFPWNVRDIIMGFYQGDPVGSQDYYLRMGSVSTTSPYPGLIYKLDGESLNDQGGVPINNYYQLAPLVVGELGSLNIYRFIRYRMSGSGTLLTTVTDQGEYAIQNETNVVPLPFPGNYKDQGIQINFTNEKAIVKFGMNASLQYFRMARVDVFGKQRWPTRPNA